ncbi:MAG: hypothetical protein BWY49_00566 [Candidatus Omnitrophica bacterium ADurb.Bin314]|jgi:glutaredoxin|nr:MAG: hypothetical protein BWY49_00566 [Candidatus Omnitrophica bacterium ADurb.Bin314]
MDDNGNLKGKDSMRQKTVICAAAGVLLAVFLNGCASSARFVAVPSGPLSQKPYVAVYGKEGCPACADLKKDLARKGTDYLDKDISDPGIKRELVSRMETAGLQTDYFLIPVVDVNGKLAIRPKAREVTDRYRAADTAG